MQQRLTRRQIRKTLEELHSELPECATVLAEPFSMTCSITSGGDVTTSWLQSTADRMGYFLGLLTPVRVTLGVETSRVTLHPPATAGLGNGGR